jgi:Zn-dependent metalloprotease
MLVSNPYPINSNQIIPSFTDMNDSSCYEAKKLELKSVEFSLPQRLVYDCQWKSDLENAKLIIDGNYSTTKDKAINSVYELGTFALKYFSQHFNLNSIDGKGMPICFYVHLGNNFNNAFWDKNRLVFGDGDGKVYGNFTEAIDIITHELAHGIIEHLVALDKSEYASCINEHMADVIATAVKQHYLKQNEFTADWLIGDRVVKSKFPGKALRSMRAPGTAFSGDKQPSVMYQYKLWGGDPHINSGILNRAFYLVAVGTNIEKGISTYDACQLWFNTLIELKPNSNFLNLYETLQSLATKKMMKDTLPKRTERLIKSAFQIVGIV